MHEVERRITDLGLLENIENEWLGIGDTAHMVMPDPFAQSGRNPDWAEMPHMHVLDLMRRPEYFSFTCKHLLNKTPTPLQLAMLHEFWHRAFPLLIGCRGLGKCARGDTLTMSGDGIRTLEQLCSGRPEMDRKYTPGLRVLGEDGFRDVEYAWDNGESDTIVLRTHLGLELEMTPNHPIRAVSGGDIVWKDARDLAPGDRVVVDRSTDWYEPSFDLDDSTAYLFGLLVGDGGYTVRGRLGFTTADRSLAEAVSAQAVKLWGKPFKKLKAKYQYELYSVDAHDELFNRYGFNSPACGEKDFPACVLSAPRSAVASFVRGLYDADGGVCKNGVVELAAKSKAVVRTLQFVLGRFGIISRLTTKHNKKYDRDYHYLQVSGDSARVFRREIGFGLPRKAAALAAVCDKASNPNLDLIPRDLVLEDLLELRRAWNEFRPRRHGRGKQRPLLSPCRLKAHDVSRAKLRDILHRTSELCDLPVWQKLDGLLRRNFYFDEVESVSPGRCRTYDVHVPEGHSFVSNGLVSHNSFTLALYIMLRATICQGSKIVIVGAGFRQARIVFEYCEEIWNHAPILRDICADNKVNGPRRAVDRCTFRIGESIILALPLGDGQKIRGQRANIIIADEFASIPVEIFENVVSGFAAVSLDPIDKVKEAGRRRAMLRKGIHVPREDNGVSLAGLSSNQTILSGTAYYGFNHFCDYWLRWKGIIESRGDRKKLEDIFNGEIPPKFDWRDYCVMRLPVELLPEGLMDEKHVAKARATIHLSQYLMEYAAVFPIDSNGFFKRTTIEACVVGKAHAPVCQPSCGEVVFSAVLLGNPRRNYVIGVDPASEKDNFSVVVLELWPEHRRVVHCWTTTRSRHKAKLRKGLAQEQDFYSYVARKIRELVATFPCELVAMDMQGGGVAVLEALGDAKRLNPGERPFYPVVNEDKPLDSDSKPGEHIIQPVQFAKADWVSEANHGLKKDLESFALLFPEFDSAAIGLALEEDRMTGRVKVTEDGDEKLYDTLEDCYADIEALKDELASIVHTQTGSTLRDHWDTPEVKEAGGKKGRLRKDRYSALLMANMAARQLRKREGAAPYQVYGGFAHDAASLANNPAAYRPSSHQNPDWYEAATRGGYGATVTRDGV